MSDERLIEALRKLGLGVVPVTSSSRPTLERRLVEELRKRDDLDNVTTCMDSVLQ